MGRLWLVVIAVVAGCSSSPPPAATPPSSTAPDKAAVAAWVEQVCAASRHTVTVSAVVYKAPKFAQGQVPTEADRPAVVATLTELLDMYTKSKAAYDAVGPSPVARGDELVAGHRKGLAELVPKLEDHLVKARTLRANALDSLMIVSGIDVVAWKPEGPGLGDLRADPLVEQAYQEAPSCLR